MKIFNFHGSILRGCRREGKSLSADKIGMILLILRRIIISQNDIFSCFLRLLVSSDRGMELLTKLSRFSDNLGSMKWGKFHASESDISFW